MTSGKHADRRVFDQFANENCDRTGTSEWNVYVEHDSHVKRFFTGST